jgi:hypothetical protein
MAEDAMEAGLLAEPAEHGQSDSDSETPPEPIPTATVTSLLRNRQSEVINFLQSRGMHKLAEFEVEVRGSSREYGLDLG